MKKAYSILSPLLIILFSCGIDATTENTGAETTNNNTTIVNEPETDSLTTTNYSELFDVELVGLTKDSTNEKGFYVDFSSACMCNAPSILLKENQAYLFNFCKDTLPPLSKEPFYTYDIIENIETIDGLLLSLKNENNENLSLLFNKSDRPFIYDLKITGEFPTDYIGNNVSEFFTYKVENFEIEDCGDFDG